MQGRRKRVQQTVWDNQSHEAKKERWGPDGSMETLVPEMNYWRIGRRNTLYILTGSSRQQFRVLGKTEHYSANAKQKNSKTVHLCASARTARRHNNITVFVILIK